MKKQKKYNKASKERIKEYEKTRNSLNYDNAKEFHKKNTIKKFFTYKLMELGIIPLSILAIWKIPLWAGWAFIKLFGIDAENTVPFCQWKDAGFDSVCVEAVADSFMIWFTGAIVLFIIFLFCAINWNMARKKSLEETAEKFGVDEDKIEEEDFKGGYKGV